MISKNRIKHIKSLHLKKYREVNQEFIIEGLKLVREAVQLKKESVNQIYVTDNELLNEFSSAIQISPSEMKQISALTSENGILAHCNMFQNENNTSDLVLVLDGIQDPGNFGTIIRSADWFGVNKIVCSLNTVDCYNTKVVQATMGSIFRVKIEYINLEQFLNEQNLPIYGTFMEGNSIYETKTEKKAFIVMGSEGNGISDTIKNKVTNKISIPKIGNGESLNVAVATSIILSEFTRK